MEIPIFTVDSFTNLQFKDNPAAVCLIENTGYAISAITYAVQTEREWQANINNLIFLPAYQCSSRGGELGLEIRDDGRLNIIGQAKIILQGTLKI